MTNPREYYVYSTPLFVLNDTEENIDLPNFCTEVEETLPRNMLRNVEVIYIGEFPELKGRNAVFANAAIYMTAQEPTNFDMLENLVHEVAHSLEEQYGQFIYDKKLVEEFTGKRVRLYYLLRAEGYEVSLPVFKSIEYNVAFDKFLADTVGYPTLLTLTLGLFASPYGATSLQEYFANGFEKYFLENPADIQTISPVLYKKIETIINDEA